MSRPLHALDVLAEPLALCRLPADAPVPAWAWGGPLASVTRTADELSVVCAAAAVPAGEGVVASAPWRALRVAGPLDLALVGVVATLAGALAAAGVSVFPLATYDTDYLLVREGALDAAAAALRAAGHTVRG